MTETFYPEYIPAEPGETSEGKILSTIINGFDNLLKESDSDYKEKIFFSVNYNMKGEHFNVNIFPCERGFNSRDYFMNRFEEKESLDKFAYENNIGLITY